MLRFKSNAMVGLALVATFCLAWYLGSRQSPEPHGSAENSLYSEKILSLKEDVTRLKQELRHKSSQLKDAHEALDDQLQSSTESAPQREASAEQEQNKQQVDLELMEKTHKDRFAEVVEKSKKVEGYDFRKEQMASYEAEALDEEWAFPRERAIEETFATEEALQGAVLKSVDCKSKRCRIQVYYQSEREVSQLSRTLNRIILENGDRLFVPQVFVNYSEDGEVASLFLSNDVEIPLF